MQNDRGKDRVLLVNIIFAIYWLVLFEGALRKWILPGLGNVVYFVLDPFVLAAYWLAFRHKLWPSKNALIVSGCWLGVCYFILAIVQTLLLDEHPLVAIFGLRLCFWYIPLSFLIGENVRGHDLARLVRQTLLVCIPIAVLVFFQFKAPADALINRYVASEIDPTLIGDAVRTCGTFSYITGQEIFVACTLPMAISIWLLSHKQRPMGFISSCAATVAVLVSFLLNGSRGIFFFCLATLSNAIVFISISGKLRSMHRALYSLGILLFICIAAASIMTNFFPTALESQKDRLQGGLGSDLRIRTTLPFTLWTLEAIQSTPLIGRGIGLGSAVGSIIKHGRREMLLSENEWPRNIQEAGIFGVLFIAYRIFFAIWLWRGAIAATFRVNNPLPLLLFSFAATMLVTQSVTIGGTPTYYTWIFAGFSLAANRLGLRRDRDGLT